MVRTDQAAETIDGDIKAVVIGLPLLPIEEDTRDRIAGADFERLHPGGSCIHFTHGPFSTDRQEGRETSGH